MAAIKLSDFIVPNPCNKAMEDRNWDGLRQILNYLDQILQIQIVNNELQFNIVNVYDVTINNNLTVENNVLIENNLTVYNNVYVTNNISVTNINVTTIDVTTIEVYNLTAIYYLNADGDSLCPPDCGGGGGGGGGTGCAALPATLYASFVFCEFTGTITLTEASNTCNNPAIRTWEGSGTVGTGTLVIRVFCEDGMLFWAIDACTGNFNPSAELDDCQTSGITSLGTSLPATVNTSAPPSSCSTECYDGLELTFTE